MNLNGFVVTGRCVCPIRGVCIVIVVVVVGVVVS